jgi:hypothetical protein
MTQMTTKTESMQSLFDVGAALSDASLRRTYCAVSQRVVDACKRNVLAKSRSNAGQQSVYKAHRDTITTTPIQPYHWRLYEQF